MGLSENGVHPQKKTSKTISIQKQYTANHCGLPKILRKADVYHDMNPWIQSHQIPSEFRSNLHEWIPIKSHNVNPGLINPGWFIMVVPPNNSNWLLKWYPPKSTAVWVYFHPCLTLFQVANYPRVNPIQKPLNIIKPPFSDGFPMVSQG